MLNKNIGGDFSLLSILPFIGTDADFFPKSIGNNTCSLFETGTDGICALILANWENNDRSSFSLWLPIHYCGQTFLRIKQVLSNYGCKLKFNFYEPNGSAENYKFSKKDIVIWVHFNCFFPINSHFTNHLKNNDVYILEDFVLAPFDINKMTGDAAVVSFRKITPLSLSIVYSKHSFPVYNCSTAYSDERRIAAWQKSVFEISSEVSLEPLYLERFHKAEFFLDERLTIHTPSKEDEALFKKINWEKIVNIRKRNYSILFSELNSKDLNILSGEYQFLMLSLQERDKVRKALSVENIFLPIHWADAQSSLSQTQLSIPIDQRYSEPDMLQLAAFLKKIIKNYAT